MRPLSAVLTVQPTPEPWSARHAQMWSMMAFGLFTNRLLVALPGPAPPIRKNTSWIVVGLAAWLADDPLGPTTSRLAELVAPASNKRPAIFTPSTSATCIGVTPLSGMIVAYPRPITTVFARFTLIVWLT